MDAPPRTARWVRVALLVSLALNVLIVGLIAGTIATRAPKVAGPPADAVFGPFFAALDENRRDAFRKRFADERSAVRENRRELRQAFRALLETVRADPFDRAAFETAFARQQTALVGRMEIGQEILAAELESMSAEERAAFAKRLERTVRRASDRHSR